METKSAVQENEGLKLQIACDYVEIEQKRIKEKVGNSDEAFRLAYIKLRNHLDVSPFKLKAALQAREAWRHAMKLWSN